jgi:hypothetical protein
MGNLIDRILSSELLVPFMGMLGMMVGIGIFILVAILFVK